MALETGWLPEPETRPYWNDILRLLEPAALIGGGEVFGPDDLVWIAVDGGQVIGAATTRLLGNGTAELRNIAGTRAREWTGPLETQICDWAKAAGATSIASMGRKGWTRIVLKLGWRITGQEEHCTMFEKALK
jgi:hypothetical protein